MSGYNIDWVRAMYGGTSALDYEIVKDIAGEASVVNGLATPTFDAALDAPELQDQTELPAGSTPSPAIPQPEPFNMWPVIALGLGLFLLMKGGK